MIFWLFHFFGNLDVNLDGSVHDCSKQFVAFIVLQLFQEY